MSDEWEVNERDELARVSSALDSEYRLRIEYEDEIQRLKDEIECLRTVFDSEEEQSYVHNEVTGLHNEEDMREIERLESELKHAEAKAEQLRAVVDAAKVYVEFDDGYNFGRYQALEDALEAIEPVEPLFGDPGFPEVKK